MSKTVKELKKELNGLLDKILTIGQIEDKVIKKTKISKAYLTKIKTENGKDPRIKLDTDKNRETLQTLINTYKEVYNKKI